MEKFEIKKTKLNEVRTSNSKFAFIDDYNRYLKYEYYDVNVRGIKYIDFDISKIEINHQLYFNHESENQYDSNAIQVLYDDMVIGYIPKNNLQKMMLDYSDGEEHQVCGFVSFVDEKNKEIKIALGFYQRITEEELNKIEHLDAKLIKTKKKDEFGDSRQDNLELVSNGEEVELEYNYDTETYIVTDCSGSEIGEISKANSKKLQIYEDDFREFYSIIIDLEYDESSNLECMIRIFIK